jgi:hypothetical protein
MQLLPPKLHVVLRVVGSDSQAQPQQHVAIVCVSVGGPDPSAATVCVTVCHVAPAFVVLQVGLYSDNAYSPQSPEVLKFSRKFMKEPVSFA